MLTVRREQDAPTPGHRLELRLARRHRLPVKVAGAAPKPAHLELLGPLVQQRLWGDHQGPADGPPVEQPREEGSRLERLPEAHVVAEDAPSAPLVEPDEPLEALALVGEQPLGQGMGEVEHARSPEHKGGGLGARSGLRLRGLGPGPGGGGLGGLDHLQYAVVRVRVVDFILRDSLRLRRLGLRGDYASRRRPGRGAGRASRGRRRRGTHGAFQGQAIEKVGQDIGARTSGDGKGSFGGTGRLGQTLCEGG